jgi:hypothetical protein
MRNRHFLRAAKTGATAFRPPRRASSAALLAGKKFARRPCRPYLRASKWTTR